MENRVVVFTSPVTWSQLRVLYESGEYPNLQVLYEANRSKFADMPNLRELKTRCTKECWDKGMLQEVVVGTKRRNMVDLYAELGMDEREQARYRVKCVKAFEDIQGIIDQLRGTLVGLDPNDRTFTETLGKIKVLSDTMFKGMSTSLAALQDISKATGGYAEKSETKNHSANGVLDDMTEEEILQDLKRMRDAGINLDEIPELKIDTDAQGGANGE